MIRCKTCGGSGKVMGGGMMFHDCITCDGEGKLNHKDYLEDVKKSKKYVEAINEIKSLSPQITDDEANEMMEKQINKRRKKDKA